MKLYVVDHAICYIKRLYEYANFFGLTTPFSFENAKPMSIKGHRKVVAIQLILIICGWALSLWGRITICYPLFPSNSLVTTDSLLFLILFLTNICSIYLPSFRYTNNFNRFLKLYFEYDKLVNLTRFKKSTRNVKYFYAELILGHITMFLLFVWDAMVWLDFFNFHIYKCYIFRLFLQYLVYIMVQLIYNFVLSLDCRFKTINNALQDVAINLEGDYNIKNVRQLTRIYLNSLETTNIILHLYDKLLDQISLFNSIFGWQIFFLFGTILLSLLDSINYLFLFGVSSTNGSRDGGNVIIVAILWTCMSLIFGIVIVAACGKATEEIHKTNKLCYKILMNLSTEACNQKVIHQLNLLLNISNQDSIGFSAAGFFTINYSMLLALFSSVTSYVIVLVQMSK